MHALSSWLSCELLKDKDRCECDVSFQHHRVTPGAGAGLTWLTRGDSARLSPTLCPVTLCCLVEIENVGNIYTTKVDQCHKHIFFSSQETLYPHNNGMLLTYLLSA